MSRALKKLTIAFLFVAIFIGFFSVNDVALAASKTATTSQSKNGTHNASAFPGSVTYDSGGYVGTLKRQDSSRKVTQRGTVSATATWTSTTGGEYGDGYYLVMDGVNQVTAPATRSVSVTDSGSGQTVTGSIGKSGSQYFSGTAVKKKHYSTSNGEYKKDHTTLGYMSNNTSTYAIEKTYKFSDAPRKPSDYYGPRYGTNPTGWTLSSCTWASSSLHDADSSTYKDMLIKMHGRSDWQSDTGNWYRYRKPVKLTYYQEFDYRRISQNYSGSVPVYKTTINYSGTVYVPEFTFSPAGSSSTWNTESRSITIGTVGMGSWRYRISSNNGSSYGSWSSYQTGGSRSVTLSGTGIYKIECQGTDIIGKSRSKTSAQYNIDLSNPSRYSESISGHNYASGSNYWVKPGKQVSVKARGYDTNSGIRLSYLRNTASGVDNRASHNWTGTATNINEWMTSSHISIDSVSRTYNSGGYREVTWKVTPKTNNYDFDLGVYYTDTAGRTTNGYQGTGLKLRVDGSAPTWGGTISFSGSSGSYLSGNTLWLKPGQEAYIETSFTDTRSGNKTLYILSKVNGSWRSGSYQSLDGSNTSKSTDYYQNSNLPVTAASRTYNSGGTTRVKWTYKAVGSAQDDHYINAYAADRVGNESGWKDTGKVIKIDSTAPYASAVTVENVSASGYDVVVTGVGDARSGVNRVQFPTWTTKNGQDDLVSNWSTSTAVRGTNQGGGTWRFRVNKSDHKNEIGEYITEVYVYDNVGNSKHVGTVKTTLLQTPTGLSATGGSTAQGEQITITWNANGNPSGTVYELWCEETGSIIYSGTSTSYVHSGLKLPNNAGGTTVTRKYKVRATNSGTTTPWSALVTGNTLASPVATRTVTGGAANSGTARVQISWSPVTGAKGYGIAVYNGKFYEYKDLGNVTSWDSDSAKIYPSASQINSWNLSANVFRWDGSGQVLPSSMNPLYKKAGGSYTEHSYYAWFHVYAYDSAGRKSGIANNGATNLSTALPDRDSPNVPSAPTFSNIGTTSFTVNCPSASDQYMTKNYPGTGIATNGYEFILDDTYTSGWQPSSYTSTGKTPNTKYTWKVRVRDNAGNYSGYSASSTVWTLASVPSNLKVVAEWDPTDRYHWHITWDSDGSNDFLQYSNDGVNWKDIGWVGTSRSYKHTGGVANETRYYRVKSINGAGVHTAYCAAKSATVAPAMVYKSFKFTKIVNPPSPNPVLPADLPINIKAGYQFTWEVELDGEEADSAVAKLTYNGKSYNVNMTKVAPNRFRATYYTDFYVPKGTKISIEITAKNNTYNLTRVLTRSNYVTIVGSALDDTDSNRTR